MNPNSYKLILEWLLLISGMGATITAIMIFIPDAFAEISSPTSEIKVPELEKSKMQTIYEDDEKKIMLPYDPERIGHFMIIGMFLTFIGGMGGGYILNEILRSKKRKD